MSDYADLKELVGKRVTAIRGASVGSEGVEIDTDDGTTYEMFHAQDCCESVQVEEIHGDPADLVGQVVVLAEESSNSDDCPRPWAESWTWTFYRLMSAQGPLVLRWLGTSNGYYSESVMFRKREGK